ncbi:hypothetical protein [Burkholderia multivorans]|uniref:hypothetical protein n=1 Tax=Burkholderia multivorans TaxID=87883 RepID=UPI00075A3B41|nr:hypothetical protein [Burkholderia multivorans]KVR41923.1 hypothetical protein WK17_17985 [Burkholderia multivorans]
MMLLNELDDVFVPILVERVKGVSVLYKNDAEAISTRALIDQCAFILTTRRRDRRAEQQIWLSERYGGEEIVNNGGGVRCGLSIDLQVKGIGANLLLGCDSDEAHSNGHLSLVDAIYEAAWSEILEEVVPFGVQRVVAVLKMGEQAHIDGGARALLVRRPEIRPAHFERAIYFKPIRDASWHREADVRRVRNSIRHLGEILPRPAVIAEQQWRGMTDKERFAAGLGEFARRVAAQLAYMRSRFMAHGCTSSNVSIDGRLLDFTSVMSLLSFGAESLLDLKAIWNKALREHLPIIKSISSICFYANKYWIKDDAFSARVLEYAVREFSREFDTSCARYFLCMAGVPRVLAEKMADLPVTAGWMHELKSALVAWVSQLDVEGGRDAYDTRLFGLSGKFGWLSFWDFVHYGAVRPARWPKPRHELTRAYAEILSMVSDLGRSMSISDAALVRGFGINKRKYLGESACLNRDALKQTLKGIIEAGEESEVAGEFVNRLKQQSLLVLRYESGMVVDVWRQSDLTIEFMLVEDRFRVVSGNESELYSPEEFGRMVRRCNEFHLMLAFYGEVEIERICGNMPHIQ